MFFNETLIELLDTECWYKKMDSTWQFKMFCNEEKWYFFNFNTDIRISLFGVGIMNYKQFLKKHSTGFMVEPNFYLLWLTIIKEQDGFP